MNQLADAIQLLAAGMSHDPLLCLAQAAAWLDPFRLDLLDEEPDDYFYSIEAVAAILRRAFPEIYAVVVDAVQHGAGYDELDGLICAEMAAQGFEMDTIESMGYGIPLPAYGVSLHEPDWYTSHAHLLPVLDLLGIKDGNEYPIEIPTQTYAVSRQLLSSLTAQADERWQQVGWLMGWLGSSTNNTSIDWDWESMSEIQPLAWEPGDIEFARAIIEEADEIFDHAQAGLKLFETYPKIRAALKRNIQRIHCFLKQPEEDKPNDGPKLRWPALDGSVERTPKPDA